MSNRNYDEKKKTENKSMKVDLNIININENESILKLNLSNKVREKKNYHKISVFRCSVGIRG